MTSPTLIRDTTDLESDPSTLDRLVGIAFWLYLLVGFFVLLKGFGSGYWFWGDEWGFLVEKDSLGAYFEPQNQHWSTFPIVVYQALYAVFGLDSYVPYQVVVISMHLALVALVRATMLRANVTPWFASVAAAVFVLYGPGEENIVHPVQISMVGTMLCGFGHALLADHPGRIQRRDFIGLGIGLLGLTTSGVAPVLVISVGIICLIRRGWKVALFHTAPLGAVYGIWYLAERSAMGAGAFIPPGPVTVLKWVWTGSSGVFLGVSNRAGVALVLAIVVAFGLAVRWWGLERSEWRAEAALPIGLFLGSLLMFALISTSGRSFMGEEFARSSRYVSMATAMTLPLLAVGCDGLLKRWRMLGVPMVVLICFGLPLNLGVFRSGPFGERFYLSQRQMVWAVASSPLASQVSPDFHPDRRTFRIGRVPIGFLLEARSTGRLHDPGSVPDELRRLTAIQFGLAQGTDAPTGSCSEVATFTGRLRPGDSIHFTTPITVVAQVDGISTTPYPFDPINGGSLTVQVQEIDVVVRTEPPTWVVTVCRVA